MQLTVRVGNIWCLVANSIQKLSNSRHPICSGNPPIFTSYPTPTPVYNVNFFFSALKLLTREQKYSAYETGIRRKRIKFLILHFKFLRWGNFQKLIETFSRGNVYAMNRHSGHFHPEKTSPIMLWIFSFLVSCEICSKLNSSLQYQWYYSYEFFYNSEYLETYDSTNWILAIALVMMMSHMMDMVVSHKVHMMPFYTEDMMVYRRKDMVMSHSMYMMAFHRIEFHRMDMMQFHMDMMAVHMMDMMSFHRKSMMSFHRMDMMEVHRMDMMMYRKNDMMLSHRKDMIEFHRMDMMELHMMAMMTHRKNMMDIRKYTVVVYEIFHRKHIVVVYLKHMMVVVHISMLQVMKVGMVEVYIKHAVKINLIMEDIMIEVESERKNIITKSGYRNYFLLCLHEIFIIFNILAIKISNVPTIGLHFPMSARISPELQKQV